MKVSSSLKQLIFCRYTHTHTKRHTHQPAYAHARVIIIHTVTVGDASSPPTPKLNIVHPRPHSSLLSPHTSHTPSHFTHTLTHTLTALLLPEHACLLPRQDHHARLLGDWELCRVVHGNGPCRVAVRLQLFHLPLL